jgi:hypothetical protein
MFGKATLVAKGLGLNMVNSQLLEHTGCTYVLWLSSAIMNIYTSLSLSK